VCPQDSNSECFPIDPNVRTTHKERKSMRQSTIRATAVAVLTLLAAVPGAFAVGTPAGTVISNQATVRYTDSNGNPLTALSNIVTTTVSSGSSRVSFTIVITADAEV